MFARVFDNNWEGKRLELLELAAALIRTLNCFFKRFERSGAIERLERFEPSNSGTTGTERSDFDYEPLNL